MKALLAIYLVGWISQGKNSLQFIFAQQYSLIINDELCDVMVIIRKHASSSTGVLLNAHLTHRSLRKVTSILSILFSSVFQLDGTHCVSLVMSQSFLAHVMAWWNQSGNNTSTNANEITDALLRMDRDMMTSSNGNLFRVTGHLCGEFTGPRWIPRTKASDAELWCFLWSASE